MAKWKKVKLGDVCSIQQSTTELPEKVWLLNLDAIERGARDVSFFYEIDKKDIPSSTIQFDDEMVLYSKLRPYLNKVILPMKAGVATSEILPLRPKKDLIIRTYLAEFLRSPSFVKHISTKVSGAKMPRVIISEFLCSEIPLPAMEEQKEIAARLDAVSDLLAKQKQLLAEQDTLIQSFFYDMFGDPIKNNKGWKIEKFKKLGTLERGKSQHRPRNAPELLGGPYPLIQTGDIAQAGLYLDSFSQTYSELGLKQSRLWKKGTLCITIAANIAKTSILNFDACFPDSVVGFVNNTSCNIMFIQIWMSFLQKILENNAPQAAQKNINLEILGNLDVILPPLELQEKFAAIVEQIESEKSKIKSAIAETQTLFNALMAEYFEE